MKIGIIGTRGIPNRYGGFEQFAEFLSVFLVENGHEVFVYNSTKHPYQEREYKGVHIIHKYDPENIIGTVGQCFYDLFCILDSRKRDFDIILQLGYTSSSIWSFLFPKKAVIVTNMDGLEWRRAKFNNNVQRFLMYAEKLAVKKSDHLVSDSLGIKNYLEDKYNINSTFIAYGTEVFQNPDINILKAYNLRKNTYNLIIARIEPENNIDVIKRGVDENYFSSSQVQEVEKENLRKEMGFSDKNFLVLLPGRLTSWKGQKLFVESAVILKELDQLSNIFFIILGDNQGRTRYENDLRNLIETNKMVDKIRIVKPMKNMPLAYAFSDLIVSASTEPEAFGRVSVEAQSMEKPILSSAIGGSLETIKNEKTGWLFENNNKEDLAKNIYNISKMNKSVLQSVGKEGRKNVIENYTKDKMCLKTLEIYQSLV